MVGSRESRQQRRTRQGIPAGELSRGGPGRGGRQRRASQGQTRQTLLTFSSTTVTQILLPPLNYTAHVTARTHIHARAHMRAHTSSCSHALAHTHSCSHKHKHIHTCTHSQTLAHSYRNIYILTHISGPTSVKLPTSTVQIGN